VRKIALAAATFSLLACRGEPPPRDYQNNPPATHAPANKNQTPSQHGMPEPSAEPSSGAEGPSAPYKPKSETAPTVTMKDQSPATGTTSKP
jgi:hypothetical protein